MIYKKIDISNATIYIKENEDFKLSIENVNDIDETSTQNYAIAPSKAFELVDAPQSTEEYLNQETIISELESEIIDLRKEVQNKDKFIGTIALQTISYHCLANLFNYNENLLLVDNHEATKVTAFRTIGEVGLAFSNGKYLIDNETFFKRLHDDFKSYGFNYVVIKDNKNYLLIDITSLSNEISDYDNSFIIVLETRFNLLPVRYRLNLFESKESPERNIKLLSSDKNVFDFYSKFAFNNSF